MNTLSNEDLLNEIDKIFEKEFLEAMAALKLNGHLIANTAKSVIHQHLGSPALLIKFECFYNRLTNKQNSIALYQENAYHITNLDSHNQNTMMNHIDLASNRSNNSSDLCQSSNHCSLIQHIEQNIVLQSDQPRLSRKPEWPTHFNFPEDNFYQDLIDFFNDPNVILTKKQKNRIVMEIFNKMISYDM
ncbi:unnamed protein product [Brachionus calyciflorus]|uniref:Uncharacterized protein n=1 Tax=Brachionus calyciflorus TaxID=104777 RepID=A0A814JWY6_9BILA|nr:unnamed protein product [Brachionus calyciflorus]